MEGKHREHLLLPVLQVLTEGADHGDVPKELTRLGILQGSFLSS